GFAGILAGGLAEHERHAPPTTSRADAPEIHSPEVHGDNPTVQEVDGSAEKPHPEAGDAPDAPDTPTVAVDDSTERPALVTYSPDAATERSIPAVDAYSLRLVASPRLYGAGPNLQHAPALA